MMTHFVEYRGYEIEAWRDGEAWRVAIGPTREDAVPIGEGESEFTAGELLAGLQRALGLIERRTPTEPPAAVAPKATALSRLVPYAPWLFH